MLTKQQELYIASRGDHLEELIAEADPSIIAGLINKGLATEHYDEWKTSEHPEIQHAFAVTDLEYCKQLLALNSLDHWNFVCNQIDETTTADYLEIFLEAPVPDGIDQTKLQTIRILYSTRFSQPSPIEKTMSLPQLFQSQSPFWANNLTLNRIESILDLYDTIKSDIFFENLKKLIELDEDHAYLSIWNLKFDHRKEA